MAVVTGYYANLTRSVKLIPWPGGHEVLFVATSDRLPSPPTKDGRATDSCFALIGAHPLLDDWGGDHWLPQIGPVLLTWSGWHNIQ